MDKKFFTGITIGIIAGIIFTIFGEKFIIDNSKYILLTFGLIVLVIFLVIILFYLFRKKVLSIAGLNFEIETGINETSSKLVSSLLSKDSKEIKESATDFTKKLVSKLIEFQTRAWMFRVSFTLFAILGGILATLITLQQNEIVKKQNVLIKEQGNYLAEMDRPFLNIEPYKFDWNENSSLINVDIELELSNIGKRPATNLNYVLEFYDYVENSKSVTLLEPRIEEEIINPIAPNSSVLINSTFFKKNINSTIIVYFKSKFTDPVKESETLERDYIYKIPPPSKNPYIPTSLMVGNRIHKELLEDYSKKIK